MGVYVTLDIDPGGIDPDRWKTVYIQTRQLLEAYPGGLVTTSHVPVHFSKRLVLSRQLELEDGDGRYWRVSGDFESKKFAEPFKFYENLGHYRPKNREPVDVDVLRAYVDDDAPTAVDVFSQKTQGYAYHGVMLAVAMWVEHSFPNHALVSGDIEEVQCRRAAEYIADNLGEDVLLPLAVCPDRLLRRLDGFSSGVARLNYFERAFRGSRGDSLAALAELMPSEEIDAWFGSQLKDFKSPNLLGVIDLLMAWLNAGLELEALCLLACNSPRGPRFKPPELADALAGTWIAVPKSKRETIDVFIVPQGQAETVYSQLGGFFLDMGGLKGRHINAYISSDEIFATFLDLFPEQADAMETAFRATQERVLERLAEMKQPVEQMVDRFHEGPPPVTDGMELMGVDPGSLTKEYSYWLDGMAHMIRVWRREIAEDEKMSYLLEETRQGLTDMLSYISGENGIYLTEDAWARLDEEDDLNILLGAAALLSNPEREMKYYNIRWAIMESGELLEYVVNRSYEDFEYPRDDESE